MTEKKFKFTPLVGMWLLFVLIVGFIFGAVAWDNWQKAVQVDADGLPLGNKEIRYTCPDPDCLGTARGIGGGQAKCNKCGKVFDTP